MVDASWMGFQLIQGNPAALPVRSLDPIPMGSDDYDDNFGVGSQGGDARSGAKRSCFQGSAGRLDPFFDLMPERIHSLLEVLYGGLRGGQARGFILALADQRLFGQVNTFSAAFGVCRFLLGKLMGLQMILNGFEFARF